ncbi:hypothetical protein [Streptomyces nigrescens]|uniref:hypothetical protein n=1 Tax=Streptomyces nigrescens TaxID=1920 RepID=UPI00347442EB
MTRRIKSPSGDSSIIATDTHPFWSADKKKWINAGDLRPGTQLRTPQGATAKITAAVTSASSSGHTT